MSKVDTRLGWGVLCIIQCATMIDLAAVPLWVGTLMGEYKFDPRQAGALVSLYIAGGVLSGLAVAPRFSRLESGRVIALVGLGLAALCFYGLSIASGFTEMAVLHALAGLSVGPALAVTEGTIGRSRNPHRLFALTAVALSLTAAGFLGIMPRFVAGQGGALFFQVICAILALGSVTAALLFPASDSGAARMARAKAPSAVVPVAAWSGVAGLFFMSVVYSMTMSFVERVGDARDYGAAFVTTVLSVMAFIKLFPAALAGILEHRLQGRLVLMAMPVLQAVCSAVIFGIPVAEIYAVAACVFIGTLIFTHVFAFGLIARLDPSGRAVAVSPSAMMAGSAIGPILGGSVIKAAGYGTLAFAAPIIGILAFMAFIRIRQAEGTRAAIVVGTQKPGSVVG